MQPPEELKAHLPVGLLNAVQAVQMRQESLNDFIVAAVDREIQRRRAEQAAAAEPYLDEDRGRMEEAIAVYRQRDDSTEAAAIAGMSRGDFLYLLGEYGVPMLQGPSTIYEEARSMASLFGLERLAEAARQIEPEAAH